MTREIKFTQEDFFWFFQRAGIQFDSLTDDEWRNFTNMFMDGTDWPTVADTAAIEIAEERKRNGAS